MVEKIYETALGNIHYWVSENGADGSGDAEPAAGEGLEGREAAERPVQLVFLPGLTADHRLFDKQIEYFEGKIPCLVWDAPGHAASYPFELSFHLEDKVRWLDKILAQEGFDAPVIVGQSMGGYVGQMYAQLFPEKLKGFVVVDSAPLQRQYLTGIEIFLLKHTEWMYRVYPWKALVKAGSEGVATTPYGQALMREFMMTYDGDQARYAALAGHGYRMLAEAVEADLPYEIKCPTQLICGEQDHAGSCIRYNKEWTKRTGLPLEWIPNAGHNSNTDQPELINDLIEALVERVSKQMM